uniref:Nucleolar MIF4G domain-containing protein 1 n=1 Tax=Nicotiana tabacum TaxID=4097 RepID=A0A1S4C911_TOBAC|nr:PREDICTED: nucleolar MIF4G domain-containing protein 1-like [Nicotiana tabacum]
MDKRTSRKEIRKEARSAKKQKKFDSWLQHQQTQKMRRSLPNLKSTQAIQSRKNSQAQRHEHLPSLNSSVRVKKDLETFPRVDASKVENRSLKRTEGSNRKAKTSMESSVDLQASPRLESSKVENRSLKRKDASNKNSKTIFMEYLEMEKKGEATSADIDLRLERKHAKKLKVKNEKLQGDDDIDMLLEGSESLEGTDIDTSRKKQIKKSVDEVLNGKFVPEDGKFDPSCVSDVDHGNTDLQTKQKESKKMKRKKTKFEEYLETEMRGRVISADDDLALERKLAKKLKVKGGRLQGGDDEMNMLFEGISSVLDSCEDENRQLAGEVSPRSDKSSSNKRYKEKKYNKEAQGEDQEQEGEQKAESTLCCTDAKATAGEVLSAGSAAKGNGKYVAPHLRSHLRSESEEHAQIRRRLRGLLNRMSEANVESITSEISTIYQSVGRTFGSQIISEEVLASCSRGPRGNEQYAAVFAAFVAGMTCLVGMDFGAKLLASLAKCFEDEYLNEDNLSVRNLMLLLSYLYTFGVCLSDLIYDFLVTLSNRLTEVDVSTILTVLQACGMKLRGDDPVGMKNFIVSVQNRVNELKASSGEGQSNTIGKRMEFMLEMICDIKNNKKRTKEDTLQLTRIKKWLQKLRIDDILIRGLKWSKLLDPYKRGQWWIAGNIDSTTTDIQDVANTIDLEVTEAQKMLQLAAAQRMNTDARRAIFCVIMSGEDYIDAFEKLLRLDLSGKQDREIMRVLVECCLQEKAFNKYYCALASKLCSHDKNHKFTLQYCLWDHFKELDSMQLIRSMHLSKFVAEMVASFNL